MLHHHLFVTSDVMCLMHESGVINNSPRNSLCTGTLSKGSREYRTPPAVAPPQVPSHYAPNYPLGHPRRDRGPGYSTLPLHAHNTSHSSHNSNHNVHTNTINQHTAMPQVGTVHPLQSHPQTPPPAPPSVTAGYIQEQHNSMPRKLLII